MDKLEGARRVAERENVNHSLEITKGAYVIEKGHDGTEYTLFDVVRQFLEKTE